MSPGPSRKACQSTSPRRKGAPAFAELDAPVDVALPVRAARIGEDRAVAEGARTVFHRPVEAADDEPFDQRRRDRLVMGSAAVGPMIDEPFRVERRLDLGACESGAQ